MTKPSFATMPKVRMPSFITHHHSAILILDVVLPIVNLLLKLLYLCNWWVHWCVCMHVCLCTCTCVSPWLRVYVLAGLSNNNVHHGHLKIDAKWGMLYMLLIWRIEHSHVRSEHLSPFFGWCELQKEGKEISQRQL